MLPAVHLDTSFLVRALQEGSPESARMLQWLESGRPVAMSTVAWTEFLCGPVTGDECAAVLRVIEEPLPLLARHGELAARLFNRTGRRRGTLADCLIAAVAIDAKAPIATADHGFARFADEGLVNSAT